MGHLLDSGMKLLFGPLVTPHPRPTRRNLCAARPLLLVKRRAAKRGSVRSLSQQPKRQGLAMCADVPNEKQPGTAAAAAALPLAEEQARIDKRETVTGRVRVRTVTDVVEDVVHEALRTVRAEVERVPIDAVLDDGAALPQTRTEGEFTIVPIVEEVLFVEKRLVLKEEIRIRTHTTTDATDVAVSLRKQRAIVERDTPDEETK